MDVEASVECKGVGLVDLGNGEQVCLEEAVKGCFLGIRGSEKEIEKGVGVFVKFESRVELESGI